MNTTIQNVRVFESKSIIHDGMDIGPGVAVVVTPAQSTKKQKDRVAQAIVNALTGMVMGDE